ncbi:bucky ball [Astyanax mexicanus]|uniref:bucky ball n=1 Tax=Astyanax mexicanus TaxID=7994 RepID=UPI0020CAF2A2|nr:bucky ball [Astyanax mexicanus]
MEDRMDEPTKASQPAGGGQSHQRPNTHSRPFFYVQPPMQPFYTYQWHMNNPYSHNIHGSGFHFGRPCMMPYSYLQYPGYVMPHAAVHPVDYRRIYERSFPPGTSAATYDFSFRQHQSSGAQRETTCAGAQTDPCEALNKLIECLDQLRVGEAVHSGKNSQTSGTGTFLPQADEEKSGEESGARKSVSGSKTAEPEYSGERCCTQLENWSVSSGKEPSLDSSSVQEEVCEIQEEDDHLHQDLCVQSQKHPKCTEEPNSGPEKSQDRKVSDVKACEPRAQPEWKDPNANWPSSQSSPVHPPSTRTAESQGTESAPADISGNYSCCILHLPFEKVLNANVYRPGSTTRSLGSPFSYSYYPPQLSHERVSVLSPSLDELSSHDELLSTDLEDMGLFPTQIYTRGRLAEVASRKSTPCVGELHTDMCVFYPKRLTCSVCGSSALKEHSRPKAFRCETHHYGDVDDSDEEDLEANVGDWEAIKTCKHCLGGNMTKIHTSKKSYPLSKHRFRHREELKGKPGQTDTTCTEHMHCCEKWISPPEMSTGHSTRGINTRLCKERRCRTMGVMPDQVVWESAGGNARTKPCRAQPLPQRQERMSQRKSRLKHQESRNDSTAADDGDDDDDDDEEEEDKGEGTTKRGGVRC